MSNDIAIANNPFCVVTTPAQPRLLPNGHQTWGILHSIEPVGGGLICTTIGGCKDLFPEEYSEKLQGMIGQTVAIVRAENKYGCGVLA